MGRMQEIDPDLQAARLPTTLWIELTSKCPFDCVFCSRKLLRGDGEHMDFGLFRSILEQLDRPEMIRLNYSGESIHYPRLGEAIRLAAATGAVTELVTALASVTPAALREILECGLDRLSVSLHALDSSLFRQLYRFSSLEAMRQRIDQFLEIRAKLGARTTLDFAFVAMDSNLGELGSLAALAESLGVSDISVHPVLKRDPIPADFSRETTGLTLTEDFRGRLGDAVSDARRRHPSVRIQVANPAATTGHTVLDVPAHFPGPLPSGARIATCEQSPWETVHILANGDVMPCEVQDKIALGNLRNQTLAEVWRGDRYRAFRHRYSAGRNPHCRECPWKSAYRPARWTERVAPPSGSAQLLRGWYAPEDGLVWSKTGGLLVLASARHATGLRLGGVLPPSQNGIANHLRLESGGAVLGEWKNESSRLLPLEICCPLDQPPGRPLYLEMTTRHAYSPARSGQGTDQRVLGFALQYVELA